MFSLALPPLLALSLARFPPRSAVLSRPRTLVWCLFSPVWECVCLRVISLYRSPSLPQFLAFSPARALPFSLRLPQIPSSRSLSLSLANYHNCITQCRWHNASRARHRQRRRARAQWLDVSEAWSVDNVLQLEGTFVWICVCVCDVFMCVGVCMCK